jgi:hypothetical protein
MATTMSEAAVSPTIRAVMLDYGKVLCFLPTPDDIARMARIFRIDPGAFLPIYIHSRGPYDRGDLLPEEYWHTFASQAGVTLGGGVIEKLRHWDIEMWSRTNYPMILWLESLRSAGVKTAIPAIYEYSLKVLEVPASEVLFESRTSSRSRDAGDSIPVGQPASRRPSGIRPPSTAATSRSQERLIAVVH